MKIKELVLFIDKLEDQKKFYLEIFGFKPTQESSDQFTIQVGHTRLVFRKTAIPQKYHYCFMIPSNKLQESITWLKKRVELIKDEAGNEIQFSKSWNADAVYFYDGVGNVTKFIAHYDTISQLKSARLKREFNLKQILSVNEIGMAVKNIENINERLEMKCKSKFWSGNKKRSMANGGPEGRLILANKKVEKTWFPTQIKTNEAPFELIIEVDNKNYDLRYANGELSSSAML